MVKRSIGIYTYVYLQLTKVVLNCILTAYYKFKFKVMTYKNTTFSPETPILFALYSHYSYNLNNSETS